MLVVGEGENEVGICSGRLTGTYCVDQADLKFKDLPAVFGSWMLGFNLIQCYMHGYKLRHLLDTFGSLKKINT